MLRKGIDKHIICQARDVMASKIGAILLEAAPVDLGLTSQ